MESQSLQNNNLTQTISEKNDEGYVKAVEVCTSFIITPIFSVANELNLFEIIAKEVGSSDIACLSSFDIMSHLSTPNRDAIKPALDHVLRLLATHSILTCSSRTLKNGKIEILYGLAPAGRFFVKDVDGVSMASLIHLSTHRALMDVCYYIKDAIVEGENPFCKANKMSVFEYMATDHKLSMDFQKAMSDNSTMVIKRILQTYKGFEGLTSLVDVGGGIGTTLDTIISAYPSIAGINFDLPHIVENAPSYNTGIKHIGGDMFVEIPKGDAILLKLVCHNWSDEQCLILLKNCYLALPEAGKVIVIDLILSRIPETSSLARCASQFDNMMFIQFGAKERTEQEFEVLAKGVGFSNVKISCLAYGHSVIEFYK